MGLASSTDLLELLMRMISPQIDAPQETIAEDQEEYQTVTGAFVNNKSHGIARGASYNTIVTAWRPNQQERRRIAAGDDIYISLLTFGAPMQPVLVSTGREEAAAAFGVGIRL